MTLEAQLHSGMPGLRGDQHAISERLEVPVIEASTGDAVNIAPITWTIGGRTDSVPVVRLSLWLDGEFVASMPVSASGPVVSGSSFTIPPGGLQVPLRDLLGVTQLV